MSKRWSAMLLVALSLLGYLLGTEVEAQEWHKPAPSMSKGSPPPRASPVLQPTPPQRIPQNHQTPQVVPSPPPKAPEYPQAPKFVPPPPPPPPPAHRYPHAPRYYPPPPPPPPPPAPQYPHARNFFPPPPPPPPPLAPQYPHPRNFFPPPPPPPPPPAPQYPHARNFAPPPPPPPPPAPQYSNAPNFAPPPPPPPPPLPAHQYPYAPNFAPPPPPPPPAHQYPHAPNFAPPPPPPPPPAPQYPETPNFAPPPPPPPPPAHHYPHSPNFVQPPPPPPPPYRYPHAPNFFPPPPPPPPPAHRYPHAPNFFPPPPPPPPPAHRYPHAPNFFPPPPPPPPPAHRYPHAPNFFPPPPPPPPPAHRYPHAPNFFPPPPPPAPQYPQPTKVHHAVPQTPSIYKPSAVKEPSVQSCEVTESVRIPCGGPDISAAGCEAINCCFNGQQCYFGKTVTVQCTKDAQFILVVAKDATLPNIDLETISLLGQGQGCAHVDSNSEFAIYHFPVTACGSAVMEESGVIIYENRMSSSYEVSVGPNGVSTRNGSFDLLFQCRYIGTSVETVLVEVLPLQNPPLPVAALGPISVRLRLANGQCNTNGCDDVEVAYSSFYTEADYPVTKVLRDPVYVEVQLLERTDPVLVLTLGRCWTTTSPNPHSLPQLDILIDGCPYSSDHYLSSLVPVGPSSGLDFPSHYRRFIFQMFTFVDLNSMHSLKEQVYIHCSTAVCSAASGHSCEPSCYRKKRDVVAADQKGAEPKVVATVGPVIMQRPEE